MGARGPLSKAVQGREAHGHRTRAVAKADLVATTPAAPVPVPPDDLGDRGRAVFALAHALAWVSESDWPAIEHLARLEDQWVTLAAALAEHGSLLSEPIVTPRGDVVGTRLVPNPAEMMLRRLDNQLVALRDRLGMVPLAKARLGISVASAKTALAGWLEREMQVRGAMQKYWQAAGLQGEEFEIAPDR